MRHALSSLGLVCLFHVTGLVGHLSAADDPLATRWAVATLGGTAAEPGGDISFEAGEIAGATACNHFGGGFARSGADGLTITLGRMTRRGCHGVALERERQLIEALAATRAFRIERETLVLSGERGTELATLRRVGNAGLEGQRHKIVSFLKDGGLHSVVLSSGATVEFRDGAVAGATGCRAFAGRYRIDEGKLAVEGLAVTARTLDPCPPELEEQDAGILDALPRATGFDAARNLIRLLEPTKGWAVLWITPAD
ncbi:MAG: META domain-containing protein [Hyphomicrobiaceae bacterium]|nr:META domain-containing protein [Hyphomicrobiaceae bacterium]